MTDFNEKPDELPEGLHLIDLPLPLAGFYHFISSWFFVDNDGRRILVDPGPTRSVPLLLEKLSEITDGLDLILLTHIHLDHSGGVGEVVGRYENAKVVVHQKAKRHLVSPEKLWNASMEVLGEIAEAYGRPSPLDLNSFCESNPGGIEIIETPGHAPHHLCFAVRFGEEKLLFIGEAAGLRLPFYSPSGLPYLWPTTPPRFDLDAAMLSLSRIENALCGDELLCYAHWGLSGDSPKMIKLAKGQLEMWASVISGMIDIPEETITDCLLSRDPLLKEYERLPEDLRIRDRLFIINSVKGFLKFFKDSRN
ncbi:MAG: MBL fold metallo-hydrolase [Synergistaceae bacterium]|jgi:glyoxylase-like metal-dependent hydrolase (beta-lactamase superfamily II)|nr:MBL fold metallo-hydrolase [Synergistaceae bacterium]